MRPRPPLHPLLAALGAAALCAAVGFACGGPGASGGIGGSGISQGPISGFGSIFVTGVEWDTSAASVSIDGVPATEAELGLGMVVRVEGVRAASGATGMATRVEFRDAVEGPVAAITPIGNDGNESDLTILGQTVRIERGNVVFEDATNPTSGFDFDTVSVDDVVEVSGLVDPAGLLRASRIEKKGVLALGATRVEIEGEVASLDAGAGTFDLGSVRVSYDPAGIGTDLSDLPGGPMPGQRVEVHGVLGAPDAVDALRIEPSDGDLPDGEAELEGFITRFVSLADFDVAGQPVQATAATLEPDDPAFFSAGRRVEVEGRIVGGVLRARKLELRSFDQRIEAEIASDGDVDPAAGTLLLLGVAVHVDSKTQLEDDRDGDPAFSLASLRGGDFVLVRGVEDPAGGIRATRLERDDPDDVVLRGFLEAKAPGGGANGIGTVTVLGITVDTDATTGFEGPDDMTFATPADFFAAVQVGDLIEVKDGVGPRTLIDIADEVEIEQAGANPSPASAPLLRSAPAPRAGGSARLAAREPERAAWLQRETAAGGPAGDAGRPGDDAAAAPWSEAPPVSGSDPGRTAQGGDRVPMTQIVQRFFERIAELAAAARPADDGAND